MVGEGVAVGGDAVRAQVAGGLRRVTAVNGLHLSERRITFAPMCPDKPPVEHRTGVCANCGDEFVDLSPTQRKRFCSDNCRKRRHENAKPRKACPECGSDMGVNAGRPRSVRPLALTCAACERSGRSASQLERLEEFAALWRDGKSFPQLMAHFGVSKGSIGRMLFMARDRGLEVPYRYRGYDMFDVGHDLGRRTAAA